MTIATLLLAAAVAFGQDDPVIQVPEGFVVEKIAGSPLVERPIMACFAERGRLYVGDSAGVNLRFEDLMKGPPHRMVRLEDTDGDGKFDKSVVVADQLTFPMGALWYRGDLSVCAPPSVCGITASRLFACQRRSWRKSTSCFTSTDTCCPAITGIVPSGLPLPSAWWHCMQPENKAFPCTRFGSSANAARNSAIAASVRP